MSFSDEAENDYFEDDGGISFSSSSEEEPPNDAEVRSCVHLHCTKWPGITYPNFGTRFFNLKLILDFRFRSIKVASFVGRPRPRDRDSQKNF